MLFILAIPRNVRLGTVATQGDKIVYEYDFGIGWEHELNIEQVFPAEPAVHYTRCTGDKRACPPEDCGGPGGHEHLAPEIATDRGDSENLQPHRMRQWVGYLGYQMWLSAKSHVSCSQRK